MAIKYKINVLKELAAKDYPPKRIRAEGLLGERTLSALRKNEPVTFLVLARLCYMLQCQPGDILEYTFEDGDLEIDKSMYRPRREKKESENEEAHTMSGEVSE